MAKTAASAFRSYLDQYNISGYTNSSEQTISQETPLVTAFADAGPRRVAGNYDWGLEISGAADFATGESDATLFALLGSAGVTLDLEPTGATAGANDPNYDSTSGLMLSSYKISGALGGAVQYACSMGGTAALSRAVA